MTISKTLRKGVCLAQLIGRVTLDLQIMSLNPTLDTEMI